MLKKCLFISISIVATLVLSSCGIGEDDVTDIRYKVNLEQAVKIYEKETENKPLTSIQFDTKFNNSYNYIFQNKTETIGVNPQTEEITKNTENNKLDEFTMLFFASEIKGLKNVNEALAKSKKEVGGLSPRILTWKLIKKNNKFVYSIDVKTTTSEKNITIDATD